MRAAIVTYLPWLLSVITIWMTVLAGNKHPSAWLVGLVNQALWLGWIVAASAWGLLPMNAALWIVYSRNHWKWNGKEMRMLASLRFLHATLVHKWHVYCAGRRLGLGRWQLLIHDLSKFRPSEFVSYGRFFYAKPGADWLKAAIDPEAKPGMLVAWLRHVQRNPHHWQYWCLINGGSVVASRGTTVEVNPIDAQPMPEKYVREMLADWMGAARAYQGEYPKSVAEWKWWQENKDQLILHPKTRHNLANAIVDWFHPGERLTDLENNVPLVWGQSA